MSTFEWSAEKKKAFLFNRNVCISAGAGSGKTAALVELNSRFLSGDTHLKRLKMDQILAITFSDKAAGEMKDRIRHRIEERIKDYLDQDRDPERLMLWMEARQALLSAHISTFHSFCLRVLKEHPLEAGIDPLFEIAHERQSSDLLEECAQRLIFEGLRRGAEEIEDLVLDFGKSRLIATLCSTYRRMKACGDEAASLQKRIDEQADLCSRELEKARGSLGTVIAEVRALHRSGTVSSKTAFYRKLQHLDPLWEAMHKALESLDCKGSPGVPAIFAPLREAFSETVVKEARGLKEEVRALMDDRTGTLPLLLRYFHCLPGERALARLLGELDSAYDGEKKAHALLDFDDLVLRCRNLLRDSREVRKRYKEQFRVILVDEFQDTNEIQREIVYLLAERVGEEAERRPGQPPDDIELQHCKLFVVGDAKQSIYFFRGADVEVFSRVMADVRSKGGEVLNFQENFRTLEPIIDVINPLFAHLMKEKAREFQIRFSPQDHLEPMRKEAAFKKRVEFILTEGEEKAAKLRKHEAEALARRIMQLAGGQEHLTIYAGTAHDGTGERPARWGDIAILFRSLTQVKIYEKALRGNNIPYYVVKGRGFFRCQEVLDILHVLRYVSGINRALSLAGIIRSPLAGCSDETLLSLALAAEKGDIYQAFKARRFDGCPDGEKEKLLQCHNTLEMLECLKDRLSIAELIEEVLGAFEYSSILLSTFQGLQKVANLQKLVMLARSYDRGGIWGLEDFIMEVENEVASESREAEAQIADETLNAVKLMSIHQAKGLEFPIVILPDMGRLQKHESQEIAYSVKRGIAGRFRDTSASDVREHYVRRLIIDENREREEAESLRLLYVALTRAKDYLILSGAPTQKGTTWRDMLAGFLGREKVEAFLESRESEQDLEQIIEHEGFPRKYRPHVRLLRASSLPAAEAVKDSALVERLPFLRDPAVPDILEILPCAEHDEPSPPIRRALHYRQPTQETLYLTPTLLMTYRFCQRKYLYDSIMHKNEALYGGIHREAPSGNIREAQGWAAHRALEELTFHGRTKKDRDTLEHYLIRLSKGLPLLHRRTMPVMNAILSFLGAPETESMGLLHEETAMYREYPFTLHLEGSPAVYLSGAIDLLFSQRDGDCGILDYKYAEKKDDTILDYDIQLLSYALAVRNTAGVIPRPVCIVFLLEKPVFFRMVEVTAQRLDDFEKEIASIAQTIVQKKCMASEDQWSRAGKASCRRTGCRYIKRCWND